MLPIKLRRGLGVVVPLFTAVALLGLTNSVTKLDENLMQSGLTLAMILAALNIWVAILASKHQIP